MSTQFKKRRTTTDSTDITTYLRDFPSSSSLTHTLFPFNDYGDEDKSEGKEEKQRGSILQQLESLPIESDNGMESNWFCANTTFAKQTCIQRTPQDIENWTTEFRSGLSGGMTAAECKRKCGQPIIQSSSSSSSPVQPLLRTAYRIPGSQDPVIVPNVNSTIINDLVASMLKSNELANLLPSSRTNYVGFNAAQQSKVELETLLTGLISASKFNLNDKYYLNRIIQLLRGRNYSISKFVLYPLLTNAIPQLAIINPDAYLALLNYLPHLEKLRVIFNTNRLRPTSVKQLIKQGIFQFDDDEIEQKAVGIVGTAENRELWNLRDGIISNFIARNHIAPEMIDGFFELRHQEEVRSPLRNSDNVVLTPNLRNLFDNIGVTANYLSPTFYEKLLRLFLKRGYYLPLNLTGEFNSDPLNIAIKTNDLELIEEVAKHYANEEGIARIKTMMDYIVAVSLPTATTEKAKVLLQYAYNTFRTILMELMIKIKSIY